VYKAIATIRGEDEEDVRQQLIKNTQKLYNLA
jgi:Tat protein secretion system quality control protein TatD with DNase activity